MTRNLKTMSTARFTGPKETKLDKKLSANLRSVTQNRDKWATKNMLTIMCDGLETGVQLKHRGKAESDRCRDRLRKMLLCECITAVLTVRLMLVLTTTTVSCRG